MSAVFRDGCAKMFALPLAPNKATANQMKGLEITMAFGGSAGASAEMTQLEDEMAAEMAQEASNRDKDKNKENSPGKALDDSATVTPALSRQTQGSRYVVAVACESFLMLLAGNRTGAVSSQMSI